MYITELYIKENRNHDRSTSYHFTDGSISYHINMWAVHRFMLICFNVLIPIKIDFFKWVDGNQNWSCSSLT